MTNGGYEGRTCKHDLEPLNPPKIKSVLLARPQKEAPNNKLEKRGWARDTTYVLCRVEEETVDHLFTKCVLTKFVLVMGVEGVQARDLGNDVFSIWDRWSSRKGLPTTKAA